MSCQCEGPRTASGCTPCSPGIRNRYFRGKLLTVADYEAEQRYAIQRRRLINRQMLGWGVVSGLGVTPAEGEIGGRNVVIGEGVAFDARGRELVACEPVELREPTDMIWLTQGRCGLEPGAPPKEPVQILPARTDAAGAAPALPAAADQAKPADDATHYLLCAHYAERRIDRVVLKEGCGDPVCEANHICETVVYSLTAMADCPPGLAACPASAWAPGPNGADIHKWERPEAGTPTLAASCDRGPQRTLAKWSLDRSEGGAACCEPTLHRGRDGFAFDPEAGVPLACVTIAYRCGDPYVAAVTDSVGPRRLTRPNDVLFDLIRGCDLTRIKDVGWRPFLGTADGRVSFEDYAAMFVGGSAGTRTPPPLDTRFWVLFSGPVQTASLSPHAITFTLLHWDSDDAVSTGTSSPKPSGTASSASSSTCLTGGSATLPALSSRMAARTSASLNGASCSATFGFCFINAKPARVAHDLQVVPDPQRRPPPPRSRDPAGRGRSSPAESRRSRPCG